MRYDDRMTVRDARADYFSRNGCGSYAAVWLLSLTAFPIGLVIAPRRLWRAFRRGRQNESLYHEQWDDRWLDSTVGDVRHRLKLDQGTAAGAELRDLLLFAACGLPGLIVSIGVVSAASTLWHFLA